MEKTFTRVTTRLGRTGEHAVLLGIDGLSRSESQRGALLSTALRDGDCLVAEEQVEPCGFVILTHGSFFSHDFIPLIFVAPERRRLGIGQQLLAAAVKCCTSEKLFTSTNSSNAAAQALLSRAGFIRSGVVENLDEGDPELVYFRLGREP